MSVSKCFPANEHLKFSIPSADAFGRFWPARHFRRSVARILYNTHRAREQAGGDCSTAGISEFHSASRIAIAPGFSKRDSGIGQERKGGER